MATSAKRYGLEVKGDLELELRLRRMESRIDSLVGVTDFGVSQDTQRVTTIPIVTSLRVKGRTPGSVTVAWNQLRLTDLRRYELEIATNLAFTENKQAFNVAGTEFNFSTLEVDGGGGGTSVFARVRARVSNGNAGNFSVVLNTSTGQAQTDDIADEAVTEEKVEGAATLPPTVAPGNSLEFLRANVTGTALEYAYELPSVPTVNRALIGDGADVGLTAYTFPAAIVADTVMIGSATNVIGQTSWTVPSSLTNSAPLIGSSGNLGQVSWTIPTSMTNIGRMFRVSASNVISESNWDMPLNATVDNVVVGDGTDFVLVNQNPTDGAATTTTHSNRAGNVEIAGGFKLYWDTVDLADGVDTTVATFTAVRSVMACWGEAAGTNYPVKAYISTANTTITLRQDNGVGPLEVTYWAIEEI